MLLTVVSVSFISSLSFCFYSITCHLDICCIEDTWKTEDLGLYSPAPFNPSFVKLGEFFNFCVFLIHSVCVLGGRGSKLYLPH